MKNKMIKKSIKKLFDRNIHFTNENLFALIQEIDRSSDYPSTDDMECPFNDDGFPDADIITSWMNNPDLVYFYVTYSNKYGPYDTRLIGIDKIFSDLIFTIGSIVSTNETFGYVDDDFLNI